MLWICLTAWAGLFIWYFRMRKKAEDHKLVRRIFCLAATGFIAGTALCLPIGVRKVSGDEKAELQLERGALGSQPTEEKLEVSVGNQKPEKNYTVCTCKSLQRRRDRRGVQCGDRGAG